MQQIVDQMVKNVGIVVTGIIALCTVISPLVGLVTTALVKSGFIAADSRWAILAARLFMFTFHAESGQREQAKRVDAAKATLTSIVTVLLLSGCAALVPHPTSPCSGLYCLQWDGAPAGIPGDVLICAKSELEARKAAAPLLAAHPMLVGHEVVR
jgi:hypothetical protein